MVLIFDPSVSLVLTLQVMCSALIPSGAAEEIRDCKEQEYKDRSGNCRPCRQCEAGYELSQECGFGYGEDAECVPCRSSRFKEDRSLQKCKPCLDCALLQRLQKDNCSSVSNAQCGDCLPGFYRKTKLSGFQDMECIPCGDPPPPYEPHCSGRVNLVPLPPMATSPRDVALAAVICSALATVLLALLVLCAIYCKRQLLEKKPSASSLRSQDFLYSGAELSCLDPRWLHELHPPPCCQCCPPHGPVHLVPALCCEESCSLSQNHRSCSHSCPNGSSRNSPFPSHLSLSIQRSHPEDEEDEEDEEEEDRGQQRSEVTADRQRGSEVTADRQRDEEETLEEGSSLKRLRSGAE